jgi:putative ABC transport system permease protein
LRDGATLVVPALATGVPAGIALSRMLSAQLYGVEIADPSTLLCVGLLLSGVGLAATLRPAARASRIDPLTLLRDE